ncbi:neuropeptide FF receptor 2-like isoform X2 [Oculina patagonica]
MTPYRSVRESWTEPKHNSTRPMVMNNSSHIYPNGYPSCPYAVSIFFTVAMTIISIAAIIGNCLVIFSVYKTPSLRTSTNYYYINMAVSDIFAGVTIWPLYLTDEIITSTGSLIQGPLATVCCKVGMFFRLVSTIVSILSLVLIAIDRFIATVFPLKASLITQKMRALFIFATWLISMAYCILAAYRASVQEVGQEIFCRFSWNELASAIYFITGLTLFTITPLITIIILYLRIMRVLKARVQPQNDTRYHNYQNNRSRQNRNIMKIFKSIVLAYFITYSFYCVFFMLKISSPVLFIKDRCKLILGFTYFVLPSLSTAINPVILFAFSTNFRQALRRLCPFLVANSVHVLNTSTQQGGDSQPDVVNNQTPC